MTFDLPFPKVSDLSQNARHHWRKRAGLVKAARREGWAVAASEVARSLPALNERPLPVQITFHPPDLRPRNFDNCISALKAYADGVADAIGVPDEHWRVSYHQGDPVKGGKVTVRIGGAP